jgi:glycolate oxidase FAD binding subunit
VTLAAMNAALARERQWLPLESPFEGATIGGILATNDAGPLRHRYGTPRDLVIGVTLATTDGKLVKAGGVVVKNVAGYDLGKLVTGSFGSLAVIVHATFKLTPIPAAFGTQVFRFADRVAAAEAAGILAGSNLDPAALDVRVDTAASESPIELLARFASTAAAVDAQMADAERLLAAAGARTSHRVVADADEGLWRTYVRRPWEDGGAVVKASWLPASLGAVLGLIDEVRRKGVHVEMTGRAGAGAGAIRIDADTRTQVAVLRTLRERFDVLTRVSLVQADAGVKQAVGVWEPAGSTASLLSAIKRAFDPAGVLVAGQGPV